jgi:archaellum biogenesis ATPase FlaH
MQDDWALYCLEESRRNEQPSITTAEKPVNGSTVNNQLINGGSHAPVKSSLSRLIDASVNGRIKEIEERLAKERDVIPGMVTTGTVTLVYAPSGAGKTVWILGNLFQSIRNNLISGSDVIYFNEDDGAKGVLQKAKLGKDHGITMVTLATSPDPSLRTTTDALRLLNMIRLEGEADGKIIICDTLKKFAPVLNKADMREVLHVFREFAAAGGTVVLLGHCNKHRTMDGRLVYEGVGDLKADVDNMFGLDPLNDKFSEWQELLVINEKDRSQVSFEGGFKYKQTGMLVGYSESVDSVEFMSPDDISGLKTKQRGQINIGKALSKYEDEFVLLQSVMKDGRSYSQSDLFGLLNDDEINPNGCSRKTLRTCIDLLKDNYLKLERRGAHGKKFYRWQSF